MRTVLYIGDFVGEHSTENYVAYGLEQLGCQVLKLQDKEVPNPKVVLGACFDNNVDFVLFSKGYFNQAQECIDLLRKNGIRTVGWLFDLFFDTPAEFGKRKLTSPSFFADICCMTDGGHQSEWKQYQVNHKLLRQGIHAPEAFLGNWMNEPTTPPIAFIGTKSYLARVKMIDFLELAYGEQFRHYGRGSREREVRGIALNDLLASTKIVVGDSVPSPKYWSNRIYEILGRGGFLLHPKIEGMDSEFVDGVHYVSYTYGDLMELKAKIDYYLNHDQEREKIRAAGHELVKKNYTYTDRCKQLLQYVDESK